MQPTVFASYQDAQQAERLVTSLLEAGIAPEDLSVIVRRADDISGKSGEPHLEEINSGLDEDLPTQFGNQALETEGSYTYESEIGGGISTSSRDDSVSGVEEMDDSQSAAERMTYPASAQSFSSQEDFDVSQGANTGFFNTTKPGPEGLGSANNHARESNIRFESELSSLIVPGLGLVLGDGTLATEVVGAGIATERGGSPATGLKDYLKDQGVQNELAFMLARDFEEGGAVVAIATPPGGLDPDMLEDILESSGARNVQMVEAAD